MLSLLKEISSVEANIRQASAEARADMRRLDSRTQRELNLLYEDTRLQLADDILDCADSESNLSIQVLQNLLARVDASLMELQRGAQELLLTSMMSAAEIGTELWYVAGLKITPRPVAENAVCYVQIEPDEQGFKLVDRLTWLAQQTRRLVTAALQQQVMAGDQARRIAQTLRQQGKPLPTDLLAQSMLLQVDAVACSLGAALLTGQDSPYQMMARLLRSELNHAHVEAYRLAMATYPQAVGERLLLEPIDARKRPTDIQTHIDLYGLGPGVYPIGRAPWSRHTAALNFIEAVFEEEIPKKPRPR